MAEELEVKLGKPLSARRAGDAPASGGEAPAEGHHQEQQGHRKRSFEDGGGYDGRKRQHDGRRYANHSQGGGYHSSFQPPSHQQQQQRRRNYGHHQQPPPGSGGSLGGGAPPRDSPKDKSRGYPRRPAGAPQHHHQPFTRDNETRIRYKWTVSADQVRILSVSAFNAELLSVSSNGNLVLDSAGHRTFRVFQALNMCLQPLGLKLVADEPQPQPRDDAAQGDAASSPASKGYKGGNWKLTHTKHKWTLDFKDGMKISAFPNRDWKKILPNLEALPESVVFSYETSHL